MHSAKTGEKLLLQGSELSDPKKRAKFRIIDCRGKAAFEESHIESAINIEVAFLQDPLSAYGALKPWSEIEEIIRNAGVKNDDSLVLYDDTGLVPSAKLFWILEYLGHSAALLDGGFVAWLQNGYDIDSGQQSEMQRGDFKAEIHKDRQIDADELKSLLESEQVSIVDCRDAKEFAGHVPTSKRDGHIPGSVNIDWEQHIQNLVDPTFKSLKELQSLFDAKSVNKENTVVTYCRSGTRSCHSYFVLRLLGYQSLRNYSGSWLEWGNRDDLPVEA